MRDDECLLESTGQVKDLPSWAVGGAIELGSLLVIDELVVSQQHVDQQADHVDQLVAFLSLVLVTVTVNDQVDGLVVEFGFLVLMVWVHFVVAFQLPGELL